MKADISNITETRRNIGNHRKEHGFTREIAVLDRNTGAAIVTARFYQPDQTVYCVVWLRNRFETGCGRAAGGGYHKESAALGDAFCDIGIVLSEHIEGVGQRAMIDACEAVARALTGKCKFFIHEAHA